MPSRESLVAHDATLEALQSHHVTSRRSRPPDIDTMAADENRVPLRAEKLNRRESRLGLRNIFGRSKASKELGNLDSPRDTFKSPGSRTSVLDIGPTSPSQGSIDFDKHLTTPRSPRPLSTMFESHQGKPIFQRSVGAIKVQGPVKPARGPLATWHPPPLFKVFPQAIKHMTLPAPSLPAEVILRMHERRSDTSREETAEVADAQDGSPGDKPKQRKKHLHKTSGAAARFEWTNKTYVLVTSGYLLQYAPEGPFDRLPEKVLHLGKNSAAFASDVIPGRHWVIQVSSAMDGDGTSTPDTRSIFSRLPFRAPERRHTSNFLMVFETVEDMEGWIATLRHEIEILGGKKSLTETGTPKAEDGGLQLREQPSQRTLVVRDPARLSRAIQQSIEDRSDDPVQASAIPESDSTADQPLDDTSTTNSFVSHDGRQLDNLREGSNRLSFISSGQRTVVTSTGSSREPSPTIDTFPTHFEEKPRTLDAKKQPEAKPRPNAAAISDRRQSMQGLGPFVDLRGGGVNLRPQSTFGPGVMQDSGAIIHNGAATRNFSVPNSSNRRFSYVRQTPQEAGVPSQAAMGESMPRSLARKTPPTTLPIARPLSMVADQPSPMEEAHERPNTRHGDETRPHGPNEDDLMSLPRSHELYELPSRRSSLLPPDKQVIEVNRPNSSRRLSDMRHWRIPEYGHLSAHNFSANLSRMSHIPNMPVRSPSPQRRRSRSSLPGSEESARRRSSIDTYSDSRSDTLSAKARSQRRASMQSVMSDRTSQYSCSADLPSPLAPESLPLPAPPPTAPLPPIPSSANNPHLRGDISTKGLHSRRSMPQLIEGLPPQLPPPVCSLPPIPQKQRAIA